MAINAESIELKRFVHGSFEAVDSKKEELVERIVDRVQSIISQPYQYTNRQEYFGLLRCLADILKLKIEPFNHMLQDTYIADNIINKSVNAEKKELAKKLIQADKVFQESVSKEIRDIFQITMLLQKIAAAQQNFSRIFEA